ncbi:MAG: DUF58 domain-containing protein [Planctomycetota bacterium]|nr:MAG: DUF58 domain-containing protein [Planctomycetota bacterium]REK31324.1 MAG: DUF58 domain-containing protein [Planctomycetota bacterium]REK39049.1 MAG: DUF58 domain-containing protein [Planctomycetota bacterium]
MPADNFLLPETLARLAGLEVKARGIVEGYLSGLHHSPHRGFSVEFAEHREYVPGDDLRYVDWKVYGKSDRYYLKQFEQETNFVCHLLLDVSDSMRYRSEGTPLSKLDYARHVAAALAYLVLNQQDAVGLTTFDSVVDQVVRPAGQPGHIKQIIHLLESLEVESSAPMPADSESQPPGDSIDVGRPLHEFAERIRHRSLIVVLSDFFSERSSLEKALKHLRHRKHDVSVLQVVDPAEQDFPFEEPTIFHGLEIPRAEFVDARTVAAAYRREFESFRRDLQRRCGDLAVDYRTLRTDAPLDAALSAYLAQRSRKSHSTGA